MLVSEKYQIKNSKDLSYCFDVVRQFAHSCYFNELDVEQLILAVSEIGVNAYRHGGGGEMTISKIKNGGVIKVEIEDFGKGIKNVQEAMNQGYTTISNSLGIGLGVAERSTDYMQIDSRLGHGTKVTLEKHRPIRKDLVDYGVVSLADGQYDFNGDQFLIKEYGGDSILVALIDGPGQGYDAYAISSACKAYLNKNYTKPIDELFFNLNSLVKESSDIVGITGSMARFTPGKITYKGFGDTHCYKVHESGLAKLINVGGRIGNLMKYKEGVFELRFDANVHMLFCTDGIKTLPEELQIKGSSQEMANAIFNSHVRSYGDASVLVVNYSLV